MLFEPLLLMWMLTKGGQAFGTSAPGQPGQSKPGRSKPKKPPKWPTTSSPPPVPAFVPNPPMPPMPAAPDANTATPLATLAKPRARKPAPSPVNVVRQKATRAATSAAKNVANKAASSLFSSFGFGTSSEPMQVKTVYDLQGILNTWGATLTRDGKYGPKTASAWQSMAKRNNLPPTISRNGPTTAKVAVRTWEALNVPNIP